MSIEILKQQAIEQLKEEFNPDLNYELTLVQTFDNHPLKDAGLAALFSFAPESDQFFIFQGNALPMIYPDWNLTPEELWAVNIGSEYFIKMGVAEDKPELSKLLAYVKMVATVFQEQLYITLNGPPKVEKVYTLDNQRHVVGRTTFDGKVYSWIVGDIPHFVYKKDLPPQVTWSLHMGRLLLT